MKFPPPSQHFMKSPSDPPTQQPTHTHMHACVSPKSGPNPTHHTPTTHLASSHMADSDLDLGVLSRHSGADFEAGRVEGPAGEQLDGVEVADAREPSPLSSHAARTPAAPASREIQTEARSSGTFQRASRLSPHHHCSTTHWSARRSTCVGSVPMAG